MKPAARASSMRLGCMSNAMYGTPPPLLQNMWLPNSRGPPARWVDRRRSPAMATCKLNRLHPRGQGTPRGAHLWVTAGESSILATVCPSSPKPQMTTGADTASARRAASASAAAAAAVASSARWAASSRLNTRRLQRVQHHPVRPSYNRSGKDDNTHAQTPHRARFRCHSAAALSQVTSCGAVNMRHST